MSQTKEMPACSGKPEAAWRTAVEGGEEEDVFPPPLVDPIGEVAKEWHTLQSSSKDKPNSVEAHRSDIRYAWISG
jgi:hypothetical protein